MDGCFLCYLTGPDIITKENHSCRFLCFRGKSNGKKDYYNSNYICEKTLNFYFQDGDSLTLTIPNPAEDDPREGVV
jgi:hypothetical protein